MSQFLKRNRQQLKAKIYAKLGITEQQSQAESSEHLSNDTNPLHASLDRALRQTEKKKLSVRKLIAANNADFDFSDELANLKWRIDAMRNLSKKEKTGLPDLRSSSLTGKEGAVPDRELTFDQLYERQKQKFATLKQRRKNKTTDPKYIEMVGNIQMRKQKRKAVTKSKLDKQTKILDEFITQKDQ